MKGGTIVFDKSIYPKIKFPPKNLGEDVGIQRQCWEQGYKIYTTDRKNFAIVRHDDDTHTSHKKNEELIKQARIIAYTDDLSRYIDNYE